MERFFVAILGLSCMFLVGTESVAAQTPKEGEATTSALTPVVAAAQQPASANSRVVSQGDVNEHNAMSDPKAIQSASDNMDDWADSVLKHFKIAQFGENDGKVILFNSQSVALKPTDPQYGDTLVNAFDKAMMGLQEKYLMIRFGKISTEKIRSRYSDRSTHAKDIDLPDVASPGYLGKLLAIINKTVDVTDKKLDNKLIGLGMDPAELAKYTPKMKKDSFRDKFIKDSLKQASGSISGLFPIQTNVIIDSKGRTSIGVIAIASPKTRQIAKDITLQRQSLIQGKGRKINDLLPEKNEEYLGTLGVRLVYDQKGIPAIISYGIASYMPDSDDDYVNDELKADAENAAASNADAQIAEVISGRMNAKNQQRSGEEIRKYVEREIKADTDTIEKEIKNIIKISNREAKSSARAKLQGISTIKRWRYTAKSGQKFVGNVRVWTYDTLRAVNSFNKPQSATGKTHEKKQTFQQFQQGSKPVNTMDDF